MSVYDDILAELRLTNKMLMEILKCGQKSADPPRFVEGPSEEMERLGPGRYVYIPRK